MLSKHTGCFYNWPSQFSEKKNSFFLPKSIYPENLHLGESLFLSLCYWKWGGPIKHPVCWVVMYSHDETCCIRKFLTFPDPDAKYSCSAQLRHLQNISSIFKTSPNCRKIQKNISKLPLFETIWCFPGWPSRTEGGDMRRVWTFSTGNRPLSKKAFKCNPDAFK